MKDRADLTSSKISELITITITIIVMIIIIN